jgi:hypothetical protein
MDIIVNNSIQIVIGDQNFSLSRDDAERLYNALATALGKNNQILYREYREPTQNDFQKKDIK